MLLTVDRMCARRFSSGRCWLAGCLLTTALVLLATDSLQVCMALEEEFVITIPDAEAEKILSAEDAINFVATHPNAK